VLVEIRWGNLMMVFVKNVDDEPIAEYKEGEEEVFEYEE